jgi:hypothetical protein
MGAVLNPNRTLARKRLAIIAILALAACSTVDKRALTSFTPVGTTGFVYKSEYGQLFLKDDKQAETQRLTWLAQYVADNHLCPNGYKIVSRTVDATDYSMGTLIYKGVCT